MARLHLGHLRSASMLRQMQARQNVWPHAVMYGSQMRSKQIGHMKSDEMSLELPCMPLNAAAERFTALLRTRALPGSGVESSDIAAIVDMIENVP